MAFATGLFGRHVGGGAQNCAFDGHRDFAGFAFGESEIHDVRFAVGVEHNVGRFQVAVDDAGFVRVVQGFGDLAAQFDGFTHGQRLSRHPIGQIDAFHKVADDVHRIIFAADFVDADDAGMFQLRRRRSLSTSMWMRYVRQGH